MTTNERIGSLTSYRYNGVPSERYVAAVAALQALEEAEPGHAVNAAAEVIHFEARQWAEKHLGSAHTYTDEAPFGCLHDLAGMPCPRTPEVHCRNFEHASCWFKDGQPYAFLFQPYGVEWETLQSLVDLGRDLGLEVEIDQRYAFWYPNWAVGVVIRRASPAAEDKWAGLREPAALALRAALVDDERAGRT